MKSTDLIRTLAESRAMDKEARFWPGTGMLAGSPVGRAAVGLIGKYSPSRIKPAIADFYTRSAVAGAKYDRAKKARSAIRERIKRVEKAGKGDFRKVHFNRANRAQVAPPPSRKNQPIEVKKSRGTPPVYGKRTRLGNLAIGAGLLGAGSLLGSAMSSAKEPQPIAPPSFPPGY